MQHEFLHQGVIQRFIVQAQALAETEDMWLYGITLEENGQSAAVYSQRATQRGSHAYDVNVICSRENLTLMDKIRNTLEELQGEAVEEWVSHNGQNWVNMAELAKREGKWTDIPDENSNPVPIAELQVFRERREQAKLQLPQTTPSNSKTAELMAEMEKERMGLDEVDVPALSFEEGTHTVLFLQANPTDRTVSWKDEHSEISKRLQDSDFLECKLKEHVNLDDFNNAVEDYEPSVLHFCGHGEEENYEEGTPAGLVFHNESKNEKRILTANELEQLFRRTKQDFPQLQLVFLNACHSSEQAKAISKAGVFALGTTQEITSEAARLFAAGVYRNLAKKKDLLWAIQRGVSRASSSDKDMTTLIEAYYNGVKIFPITQK
ncbi:MAG: CHAT domain-containing protein [Saprospiraceae bacterium]